MIKILVPIDFSDTSLNALQYATDLFKDSMLEITLVHVYGAQSTALMMKSIDGILIRNAEDQISSVIKEMESKTSNVVFKTKLVKNYAVSRISDLGDSGNYDLIVMGTKGVSGLKEVFMGSVAGGVISKTSAPVIVVPLDYKFKSLDKVVFAVGDTKITNENSLAPIHKLVSAHQSELEILHFSKNGPIDLDQRYPSLTDLSPKFTHKNGDGDLNQHLNVHIQNNDTDLLCLLRTKKNVIDRFFSGSVTLKQTFNSPVPIMVIHD
ncbi:MAG TPA: hypothetical protein DDY13_14775 [Cytophagales bacterium]|jgi:nucleotide-binding universal stress UspA family protein|nr:hypothetical protein [Cytophagales bacterium]